MARCIIVPYDRSSLKPGDTLPIGELGEFSVIGAGTFYSANYIPSTLFEALKLPVYYVDILDVYKRQVNVLQREAARH